MKTKYDVAIIGGGPAGMMAAGRAGELGARVVLIEKNSKLGIKLLATGGGRCNLTNKTVSKKALIDAYGPQGKFLHSAFNKFGVEETMDFFIERGVSLKVEEDNRVFPTSNRASDVVDALLKYQQESDVKILTDSIVKDVLECGDVISKVILSDGQEIQANKFIVATGGKSYPATGSTGDGYEWLRNLGHKIITPQPALTPIITRENYVKDLQGMSLSKVTVEVYDENKKVISENGDILFTHNGLSGPAIINLSKAIGKLLPRKVFIKIDFFPQLSEKVIDEKIQQLFRASNNKLIKNGLDDLIPSRLALAVIQLSGIDKDKQINLVSRDERKKIVALLKNFSFEFKGLEGFDRAMVTTGGVDLSEIDPKTMRSKLIDNLFLAGEILDLDGPTGGYNLQQAWSTGYVAGSSII